MSPEFTIPQKIPGFFDFYDLEDPFMVSACDITVKINNQECNDIRDLFRIYVTLFHVDTINGSSK